MKMEGVVFQTGLEEVGRYRVWVKHGFWRTDRRTGTRYPYYVVRAYDVTARDSAEAFDKVRRFLLPDDHIYLVQKLATEIRRSGA